MRIVLDTNVLVSALLSPFGAPAQVLQLVLSEKVRLCYDSRVLAEYRDVLGRSKFGFEEEAVAAVLEFLERAGELVIPSPWPDPLPDPEDAMFLEVAAGGGARYVVTGNLRHFPARKRHGLLVVTPDQFVNAQEFRSF